MIFVSDSFTGTAGTALESHAGETGATWADHPSYAASTGVISNENRLRGTSAIALWLASGVPPQADYSVFGTIHVKSLTGTCGVLARASASADEWLWARYDVASAAWQLYRKVGGSLVLLGSYSQVLSVDNSYSFEVRLQGESIKVFVEGVERIDATSATLTAAGRVGIGLAGAALNTTGLHLDDISAATPGPLAAGAISQTSRTTTTLDLAASTASGGTGPYTYQWYRDTTAEFTPGAGNILTGETALMLADTGLTSGATYYYKLRATDSAAATDDAEYSITMPAKLVVCEGDSLTAGTGAAEGQDYPSQLIELLGSEWAKINVGAPSETLAAMAADAATEVDPEYDAAHTANVLAIWGGTNDIFFGATAAEAYASLVAYCEARQSVGWRVAVATMLPRGSFSGSSLPGATEEDQETEFEVRRAAFNASVVANWHTFADALVDLAGDSRVGDDGDEDNATYYSSSDKTHLTAAGYGVVAELFAAGVLAAEAGGSFSPDGTVFTDRVFSPLVFTRDIYPEGVFD